MSQALDPVPYWKRVPLKDMNQQQWEQLCDGCGKCCLHKLEDADTGHVHYTNVACRLLDLITCRCGNYPMRKTLVPDCVKLTADRIDALHWMPRTCAYRRIANGQELEAWHPLISGRTDSVHSAGISIRGKAIGERFAGPLEDHVLDAEP